MTPVPRTGALRSFRQTDPIGYADGMNWYAYVGGDPINFVDPLGLDGDDIVVTGGPGGDNGGDIVVTGRRLTHTEICIGAGCGGGGSGGDIVDVCSAPLSGNANRGQTVNSRRAIVRREVGEAIRCEARSTRQGALEREIGRNAARLIPNSGTWIRGGTSRADGNYLYGAVTAELGYSLSFAIRAADAFELIDDILDRLGLGGTPDEGVGGDSPEARAQIAAGARCPG